MDFLIFFLKLLRLLIKGTKVTTGHQKWPKIGQKKSIIILFFAQRTKNALGQKAKHSAGARSVVFTIMVSIRLLLAVCLNQALRICID